MTRSYFTPRRCGEAALQYHPLPIALTYSRMLWSIERQEPLASMFAVRDAIECRLKYCAWVAAANFVSFRLERGSMAPLAGLPLKPTGLDTADWHGALTLTFETTMASDHDGITSTCLGENRRNCLRAL
jgi:hypothetical protein